MMQLPSPTDTHRMITSIADAMAHQRWADVFDHLDPDLVAHVPEVGSLVGVDALADFVLETGLKADDGEQLEVLDVLVGDRFAAIYFRITATRADRAPLDNLTLHLVRLEHDRIREIWFHNFDGRAVAEFWA
jgi:hypothetical protein